VKIDSEIKVTLPCGREVILKNSLTYAGVDRLSNIIAGRKTGINFNKFYIRHATSAGDASDPETFFHVSRDTKKCTVTDFQTENGSAGLSVLDITAGSELVTSDEDRYVSNIVRFPISFKASDLGLKFIDTNQANYSIVYYMGLAERPEINELPAGYNLTEYDNGNYDTILSVIELSENDWFGIPSTGTVNLKYDLNLEI